MDNVIIGNKCKQLLEPKNEFEKQAQKASIDLLGFDATFITKLIETQQMELGKAVLLGIFCDHQTEEGCRMSDEDLAKEVNRRIKIYVQFVNKIANPIFEIKNTTKTQEK